MRPGYLFFGIFCFLFACSSGKSEDDNGLASADIAGKKEIAGLSLPADFEPAEVKEEWLPNGDGYLLHIYNVDVTDYEEIAAQLKLGRFKELPFTRGEVISSRIYRYMDKSDEGIYRLYNDEEDPRDAILIVLDRTRMELIILMTFL